MYPRSVSASLLVGGMLAQQYLAAELNPRSPCSWKKASSLAQDFVSQLTTKEKIGLATGGYSQGLPCVGSVGSIERLGFDGMCFSDGPAGYSRADGVTVFASGITAAASWDRRLMYERAVAIGEEFRDKGSHVHLGPSSGPMGRNALGGRNWEGFGPDPYLSGIAMDLSVSGIQSTGVQACSKHYVGNEQETQRTQTVEVDGSIIDALSSNIDDRTLHELYIWPFADAVKAGTASIMCSYNRVNGNYTCANPELLSILKDELAFPGYVVSDWFATHDTESYANAGLDLEMPGAVALEFGGSYFGDMLLEAVNNETVANARLNDMAERVLTPYFLLGQNKDFPEVDPANGPSMSVYQFGYNSPWSDQSPLVPARDVQGDHPKLVRELGAAATVLLKNANGFLPLKNQTQIAVFGNGAPYPTVGAAYDGYAEAISFEYGTLDIGGGSGTVRHTDLVTPLEAIQAHVKQQGGRVQILLDNQAIADSHFNTIYPIPEVCVVFLKAFASEGQDRPSLDLEWNATAVVESTASFCPNTVVVIHGPGVVAMPWADNENVTAILSAHYPGEQIGNSIVDVLWGASEPAGRLPYTIPKQLADYGPPIFNLSKPVADRDAWHVDYTEGQMIDYRHFDANDIEPLYEFGYGLSYTTFDMAGDLHVEVDTGLSPRADKAKGKAPGGLKDLWQPVATVSVKVTNTGSISGSTVPQLYVSFPQDTTPKGTPVKVLRGFEKVHLQGGETTDVVFELRRRDLSFWDEGSQEWVIPSGTFNFASGFSSRDLRAQTKLSVLG